MAKIKQSNQYDEVERVIRYKRDRIIYISLIVSLLFAIIMLILWFCYPSDISTDGQVEQVSADISKVLSSNESAGFDSTIFESLGSDLALYACIITSLLTLFTIVWSLLKGDGLKIELLLAILVLTTGFSFLRTVLIPESDRYTYYSAKVSSAIQTGDLESLYEIYGEKGKNVKKSVEEVLSVSKLTNVKKLGDIDGLLLRGVIMAIERDLVSVYKRHPGNLILLMPEHKDDEVAGGNYLFDTRLYNPIDYSLYDIGVNAGVLTSNPYSVWKAEYDTRKHNVKSITKMTSAVFLAFISLSIAILILTVKNYRKLSYLIETNKKYLTD